MRFLSFVFCCNAAFAHVGAKVSLVQFTQPPPLLTAPDGGVSDSSIPLADQNFHVVWNDGDMDPTGRYYFYWLDRMPPPALSTNHVSAIATAVPEGNGIWAACDCVDVPGVVMCPDSGVRLCDDDFVWDTSALPEGAYWLIAIDNDPPYYLYSVGESPIRISHGGTPPPGGLFILPNGIGSADEKTLVRWVAAGDGPLEFDLAWGADVEPQVQDLPASIGTKISATDEGNGKFSYMWDTSSLPSGAVYLQLTIRDAKGRSSVTNSPELKIFHPQNDAAADLRRPDMAMVSTSGSCEVGSASDGGFAALFVGAVLALFLGVLTRRGAR
jgi:hypothetical protein